MDGHVQSYPAAFSNLDHGVLEEDLENTFTLLGNVEGGSDTGMTREARVFGSFRSSKYFQFLLCNRNKESKSESNCKVSISLLIIIPTCRHSKCFHNQTRLPGQFDIFLFVSSTQ